MIRAVTLRQKLQIKLANSPSHSILSSHRQLQKTVDEWRVKAAHTPPGDCLLVEYDDDDSNDDTKSSYDTDGDDDDDDHDNDNHDDDDDDDEDDNKTDQDDGINIHFDLKTDIPFRR